jgi:hypothetical protein
MSAGVTYWVPEIHWMLLIVGLGGMRRSGFSRISFVRSLGVTLARRLFDEAIVTYYCRPVPKTLITAISAGPFHPRMSPVLVMMASENRRTSSTSPTLMDAISFIAGNE